ncbi:hypothetical protein FB382_002578 [Nocardioides ginsengisegetis]|uniref:Uncharacterized protein n=1 Tax=Nocardioides ginsengisegetis TaxID=661491 RepID=A0A7W3J0Y0_9ACTN|nr:hypothetical protein [Nocardioides ginsengisegetis]MBA8804287.1 hypothetical protein [Nocardioides ginsengisegetis]
MSDQHKLPLYAFVILAIACSLIVANGLRSPALRGFVHVTTQHGAHHHAQGHHPG